MTELEVLAEDAKRCNCTALEQALGLVPGSKRMVVGHTIQEAGINSACENRVFRIDVGLSVGCGDGEPQACFSPVPFRPGAMPLNDCQIPSLLNSEIVAYSLAVNCSQIPLALLLAGNFKVFARFQMQDPEAGKLESSI